MKSKYCHGWIKAFNAIDFPKRKSRLIAKKEAEFNIVKLFWACVQPIGEKDKKKRGEMLLLAILLVCVD